MSRYVSNKKKKTYYNYISTRSTWKSWGNVCDSIINDRLFPQTIADKTAEQSFDRIKTSEKKLIWKLIRFEADNVSVLSTMKERGGSGYNRFKFWSFFFRLPQISRFN